MARSFEECVRHVEEAGKLKPGEGLAMLAEMRDRAEQMRLTGVADPVVAAAGELAQKVKAAAAKDRMDALRNQVKRDGLMQLIDTNGGIANAAESIRSVLHGGNRLGRESIESRWHGIGAGWVSALANRLTKAGVMKVSKSAEIDREVARAWWKINAGEDAGAGPAVEIAKVFSQAQDRVRERLNEVGATIGDATDYVTRTSHDGTRMRQAAGPHQTSEAAFQAWWAKTEPRLDEKTFEDVVDRQEFGRSVFEALVTGVHMVTGGGEQTGGSPAFEGSRNLAKSLSHERTLYWKNADAWMNHMQEFGQFRNLHETVNMAMMRGARDLALMDRLGTNPSGNLSMVMRKVQEKYRADTDGVNKFQDQTQGIQNVMGRLDGSLNIPANMGIAQAAGAVRTTESIASLGGVGVTHAASIVGTVPSELVHHGISRLESIPRMIRALTPGHFSSPEVRDVLADMGAFADGQLRHIQSVYGEDSLPGRISNIASHFMDWTGIHYIFDRTKAGVMSMLSHNLGRNLGVEHDALKPHLSMMLGKYGVGPEEWKLLQTLDGKLPIADGRAYLTPSMARNVDPAAVEAHLRSTGDLKADAEPDRAAKAVSDYQRGLIDKLLSYYGDGASHAVVTAGVRERALLLRSTRPGTGWGEVARFLTQFKMWPTAVLNQVIGREIHMSLSRTGTVWNLGMIIALGFPAGYARMSINDAALGHPVRHPLDLKTALAALAQSGGLGIFGDFLFGETSRMGAGLISTAAGPVVSDADQLLRIFNRFRADLVPGEGSAFGGHHRTGAFGDIWPDLAHMAVRHVPFANLVYLKGALDYMLWYHLYEAASPGYWERTNRRLEKEQGRPLTGYMPGQGVPWGVPGLYLKTGSQTSGLLGAR